MAANTLAKGQAPAPPQAQASDCERLALAVSLAETQQPEVWQQRFLTLLQVQRFVPSRQVLQAAGLLGGASLDSCLASCVALAPMADSLHGVFDALHDSVMALHAGADVGVDFSSVLPSQWPGFGPPDQDALGPAPFAHVWGVARALLGQGHGHAGTVAMVLRCDHPDIERFVESLAQHLLDPQVKALVLLTDAFMEAVAHNADWPLVFPLQGRPLPEGAQVVERVWPGQAQPQPCLVHRHTKAHALWVKLLQVQCSHGQPRLLFAEAMQQGNSLWYCEQIHSSNPDASVPLAPHAVVMSGSLALGRFVRHAGQPHCDLDWDALRAATAMAVRFLDNLHTLSAYGEKQLARSALATRRLALGVTGLAGVLELMGLAYGAPSSLALVQHTMATIRDAAYQMSVELAREKGAFPAFDKLRHVASTQVLDLPRVLQDALSAYGLRNSHLLAVAEDRTPPLPATPPEQQLLLAAALQGCVDHAVSVTIHVPEATPAIAFGPVLRRAWELRLKNCLVLRDL